MIADKNAEAANGRGKFKISCFFKLAKYHIMALIKYKELAKISKEEKILL